LAVHCERLLNVLLRTVQRRWAENSGVCQPVTNGATNSGRNPRSSRASSGGFILGMTTSVSSKSTACDSSRAMSTHFQRLTRCIANRRLVLN